jgi:hypothetical protein
MSHARVFNVDLEELRRDVLEPWVEERSVKLGERDWDPVTSELKVIESPELSPPELSFGQGWSNAERKATDVTSRLLEEAGEARRSRPAPTAIVVEVDSLDRALAALGEMTAGRDARQLEWAEAQRRLDGRDPEVAAVLLLTQRPARSE